jgi:hypothetical protein
MKQTDVWSWLLEGVYLLPTTEDTRNFFVDLLFTIKKGGLKSVPLQIAKGLGSEAYETVSCPWYDCGVINGKLFFHPSSLALSDDALFMTSKGWRNWPAPGSKFFE